MKFSLSTNWCNQRLESARELAELALSLGFDELELGFNTSQEQYDWFKSHHDVIPIGSIHAFCPVPLSAPRGSPELYSLASPNANERAMARLHIRKTLECAVSLGAKSVVLHAGKISISSIFNRGMSSSMLYRILQAESFNLSSKKYKSALNKALSLRGKRARVMMDIFKKELEMLLDIFEKESIVLALENLPFIEGFPNEAETKDLIKAFKGAPLMAWFDTGHFHVRNRHGWIDALASSSMDELWKDGCIRGMHLNDVRDYFDDHCAPGGGNVDFASLKEKANTVSHIVFEPKEHVETEVLRLSLLHIKSMWDI